jgi:S1-C subfamily serine protease
MKVQNEPGAYGLLAGLLVLLLAAVATQTGCARPHLAQFTTASQQYDREDATVKIETECGQGSGVLINTRTVLTAHHVLDCDKSDGKVQLVVRVTIVTRLGTRINASFDALDAERDLARLRLETPVTGAPTLRMRPARLGEIECATFATPIRTSKCGVFESRSNERYRGDIVLKHMSVWFGNSGSPVWDASNNLVGIVVRLSWCSDWDYFAWEHFGIQSDSCGARATSIEGPAAP